MSAIARTLGISRSNLIERDAKPAVPRGPYRKPDDADGDCDERRHRRARDAECAACAPSENQERREDHVDKHGHRSDDHARLEIADAAERRAHRDERELQRHRGNEPEQILGSQSC